ncbi:NAD(P)/FAD-dependent oxidoreductase [Actinotalea sp.]|uniref:NAD(P)/FAD-dependent oxidoreductase n=1 Tax=Actinotalea sp. TaxID=1872145 RepID=UPI00356B2715
MTVSLWEDQLGEAPDRARLTGQTTADVAIVGGGLTGLWTAYYLSRADPSLDIVVLEAERIGFGASGRNGGWLSALFPQGASALARRHGAHAALAQRAAMRATVGEVAEVCSQEGIDCDLAVGGTVTLARTPPQLERSREHVAQARAWGDRPVLLDPAEARARLGADGVLGGVHDPDCARVQPARLVRGLADVLEARGVRLLEHSRATALEPGRVRTSVGTVRARQVVRATEAWTSQLPGSRRDVVPVYSLMIATEPLGEDVWDQVGLREAETFTDQRHLVIYGQRTADGRIAFGGRGAPYHWRSGIRSEFDQEPGVFAALERTLRELLPALGDAAVTHRWGGPLGISRDWNASVGLDPSTGMAWAGGYVGDGLSTTNLAGRTLTDLLLGRSTALTRLPWVGHRSPRWEPEPLRWLGVNAGLTAMSVADAEERLTGRQSLTARLMAPLIGH